MMRWTILATLCRHAWSGGKAVLRTDSVQGGSRHHEALYAEWSSADARVTDAPLIYSGTTNPYGCRPQRYCKGCALLTLQGNCTFSLKASNALNAGMKLLIISSSRELSLTGFQLLANTAVPHSSGILALVVSKNTGRQLLLATTHDHVSVTCWRHDQVCDDLLGDVVMGALAVALVALGAWHSVEDLRRP